MAGRLPDPPSPASPNFRNAIRLCHFPSGAFRWSVPRPLRPAPLNFRNAIGQGLFLTVVLASRLSDPPVPPHHTSAMPSDFAFFYDWRFRPVGSPTPQTRLPKLPQCFRTLSFFRLAVSAGRLPDTPDPTPPRLFFRLAVFASRLRDPPDLAIFLNWRFWPVGSPTPQTPLPKLPQCFRTLPFFY